MERMKFFESTQARRALFENSASSNNLSNSGNTNQPKLTNEHNRVETMEPSSSTMVPESFQK